MTVAWIKTNDNLILLINGEQRIIPNSRPTKEILDLCVKINRGETYLLDDLLELINPGKLIEHKTDYRFKLNMSNELYYFEIEDRPIPEYLGKKILEFIDEDINIDNLIEFWKNCVKNPRQEAVYELFDFLSENNYPITSDGCFIGYKMITSANNYEYTPDRFTGLYVDSMGNVRNGYGDFVDSIVKSDFLDYLKSVDPIFVDSHSRSIKQRIGDIIEMNREECDPNRDNTCSTGFHIGSYKYSSSFSGDVFVYCKVNPADVVAVPPDYNNGKLRCCKYQILGYAKKDDYFRNKSLD